MAVWHKLYLFTPNKGAYIFWRSKLLGKGGMAYHHYDGTLALLDEFGASYAKGPLDTFLQSVPDAEWCDYSDFVDGVQK